MILAFVYGFPHFKSAQGLYALKRAGFDNVTAIAAPWKKPGGNWMPVIVKCARDIREGL